MANNIENNKEMVPLEHYVNLFRALDPAEAAERTGCAFDAEQGCFHVRLLYADYRIQHPNFAIACDDVNALALAGIPAQIFMLRYLLEGRTSTGSGAFLPYREMPWGDVYFKALYRPLPHPRGLHLRHAGLDAFKAAIEKMPVVPLKYGDASCQIELMPGYQLRLMRLGGRR